MSQFLLTSVRNIIQFITVYAFVCFEIFFLWFWFGLCLCFVFWFGFFLPLLNSQRTVLPSAYCAFVISLRVRRLAQSSALWTSCCIWNCIYHQHFCFLRIFIHQ